MESNFWGVLFNVILYVLSVMLLYNAKLRRRTSKSNLMIAIGGFVLMCFFAFSTGDYYHYKVWFETYNTIEITHIEPIYVWFSSISPSYFVFRFIVWGSALFLLFQIFKLSNINLAILVLLFISRYFIAFSYSRVSLCMALCFCGLAYFSKMREKKVWMGILGITMIGVSVFFHKTGLIAIGACVGSLLFIKQRRINAILLLLLLPFMAFIVTQSMDVFMETDFSDSEFMLEKGQKYFNRGDNPFASRTKEFTDLVWRFPYFITLLIYFKIVISGKFNSMPFTIRLFANADVISVVFALFFILIPSITNMIFYYRFLNFAMIPSIIFIGYCHSKKLYPTLVNLFFYLSLVAVSLQLAYRLSIRM